MVANEGLKNKQLIREQRFDKLYCLEWCIIHIFVCRFCTEPLFSIVLFLLLTSKQAFLLCWSNNSFSCILCFVLHLSVQPFQQHSWSATANSKKLQSADLCQHTCTVDAVHSSISPEVLGDSPTKIKHNANWWINHCKNQQKIHPQYHETFFYEQIKVVPLNFRWVQTPFCCVWGTRSRLSADRAEKTRHRKPSVMHVPSSREEVPLLLVPCWPLMWCERLWQVTVTLTELRLHMAVKRQPHHANKERGNGGECQRCFQQELSCSSQCSSWANTGPTSASSRCNLPVLWACRCYWVRLCGGTLTCQHV